MPEWHWSSVRGIRFSLGGSNVPATAFNMIEPLAKRVHAFGWHLQINMEAHQIVANEPLWDRVPTPLVFDHMGRRYMLYNGDGYGRTGIGLAVLEQD